MKIVVIGGTGLIGAKTVALLTEAGHEAVPASPNTGVNALTGEGLDAVLAGAGAVLDVSNSPSWGAGEVLHFFTTSSRNLLAAEQRAGVGHHVALSIVGTDRLPENGYFRAKVAQEDVIQSGPVPWSIVRATQFFEFIAGIADSATQDQTVRIAPVAFQPIAADEVAAAVAQVVTGAPLRATIEIAGPEEIRFDEAVRTVLAARGDGRTVVADPAAAYFSSVPRQRSLVPLDPAQARLGTLTLEKWLATQR